MSTIRIKKSVNVHAPTTLEAGELAYTSNGNLLYIGDPTANAVTAIGGKRFPGVLTANQALVANSTLGIDVLRTANLIALGGIYANGSLGTDGQVLTSNGTVAYWNSAAPGGVTDVLGGAGLTASGGGAITLDVGAGNGIEVNVTSVAVLANNGIVSNSTGVFVVGGSGLVSNSTGVHVGTANGITVDTDSIRVLGGSGLTVNTTGVHVLAGNSQLVSNATGVWVIQSQIDHNSLSNYSANRHTDHTAVSISPGSGLTGGGDISATRTLTVLANNGIVANATGVYAAGSNGISVTAAGINVLAGNSQLLSNSTGVWVVQTNIDHNSLANYSANRHTDHTAVSIATANGVAGGGDISATRNLYVVANSGLLSNSTGVFAIANSGLVSNSTGIHVLANSGIVTNSTGVFVTGGSGLVSNSTGVHVGAANGITVDTDSIRVLGGSTLTVNATGVHVNTALSITDLTLSGNLTVTGTLTSVDATNLSVNDSIIELARNNGADALDIGFYGQYVSAGTKYTGFFRDQTDGVYKLFSGLTVEPSTTVDTSNTSYTRATLDAYLSSGGLVANLTAVTLTANSTVAVNMTANSLTLTTPLVATSGGVGQSSYTSGDLLYASNTTFLSKLALGTTGKVLQSNGTAVLYDDVDGGTF